MVKTADKIEEEIRAIFSGNGGCHRMGLADEELVAGEADPGGVLAGIVEGSVFDLSTEAIADGLRYGD